MYRLSYTKHQCDTITEAVTGVFCKTDTLTQWFSCEIREVFKNAYFEEHLQTTVSTVRCPQLDGSTHDNSLFAPFPFSFLDLFNS